MLDLLIPEILNAAQKNYNDESISGMSFDWENYYNVVEIKEQHYQDNRNEYPYMVSVTVNPHSGDIKNRKFYGPDKLTFGIDPNFFLEKYQGSSSYKVN
jgi:hypothetical protein